MQHTILIQAKVRDKIEPVYRENCNWRPTTQHLRLVGKVLYFRRCNDESECFICISNSTHWHRNWLEFDYMVSVGSVRESGLQPKPTKKKTKAVNFRRL